MGRIPLMSVQVRRVRVVLAAALIAGLAACGGSPDEPTGLGTASSPAATATVSDDEAAVEAAYRAYWDVLVTAHNTPSTDRAPFEAVAVDTVIEMDINNVQGNIDNGTRRSGQPTFGDLDIQVEGDSALVDACVDQNSWEIQVPPGLPSPTPQATPFAISIELQRTDGGWLVARWVPQEEVTFTC